MDRVKLYKVERKEEVPFGTTQLQVMNYEDAWIQVTRWHFSEGWLYKQDDFHYWLFVPTTEYKKNV